MEFSPSTHSPSISILDDFTTQWIFHETPSAFSSSHYTVRGRSIINLDINKKKKILHILFSPSNSPVKAEAKVYLVVKATNNEVEKKNVLTMWLWLLIEFAMARKFFISFHLHLSLSGRCHGCGFDIQARRASSPPQNMPSTPSLWWFFLLAVGNARSAQC